MLGISPPTTPYSVPLIYFRLARWLPNVNIDWEKSSTKLSLSFQFLLGIRPSTNSHVAEWVVRLDSRPNSLILCICFTSGWLGGWKRSSTKRSLIVFTCSQTPCALGRLHPSAVRVDDCVHTDNVKLQLYGVKLEGRAKGGRERGRAKGQKTFMLWEITNALAG